MEKRKPEREEIVTYGAGSVRLYERSDSRIALQWRDAGKTKDTTRRSWEIAFQFAKRKAKELDRASGAQWIHPARQERLAKLERLAGGEEGASDLLGTLERTLKLLDGDAGKLEAAARYFTTHGPKAVTRVVTLGEARGILLAEYDSARAATRTSMKNEWKTFVDGRENLPLLEVTREMLVEHFAGRGWSDRTRKNAITRWATFFNRARELELWPRDRPIPTATMKPGRKVDKAPEIFTPAQGVKLLDAVGSECPRYLPYLLVAGWLGVRPSECLGLRWKDLDAEAGTLHLRPEVVGKTARERWVPVPKGLLSRLGKFRGEPDGRICLTRSREEISILARRKLGLPWPDDVLRHSYITYRLQVIRDIGRVAEEAGNSPSVIRSNYRRPIPPGRGRKWFSLAGGAAK